VVLASLGVAGYSMTIDPYDIAGTLPTDKVTSEGALGANFPAGEWHFYGRSPYGQRYSPLDQITVENVDKLELAWTYQTGDVRLPSDVTETTYQVTPLKIGDNLYICTPHNLAIAVDAATGQEKWRFDPKIGPENQRQHQTCRGVSYYKDASIAAAEACAERVYLPTSDARLIALDVATGQICPSFGNAGTVDLMEHMPHPKAGYYYSTSAPLIARDKIIVGGAVNDNYSTEEPSGVIRAFDARSGAVVWAWDPGNPDRTEPLGDGETYTANSPNMWSTASADEELGLVYVPLGNQTPDQLGMGRSEHVEKYSSSITALDLDTGRVRWVRQTVHHDLWDMDVPAQPSLIDLTTDAGTVKALVGPTKQGDIYVLNRETGEPVIPVNEVPAPGGAIEGDFTAPTQPVSDLTFMPHRVRKVALRGSLHAAFRSGNARLSRQFRHLQLGRRGGRSGQAGDVRHADLSGLQVAACAARSGAAGRCRSAWQRAGPQPQRRCALCRDYGAVPVAARHSLPVAAMGLCDGCGPAHRQDRLQAPQRHGLRHDPAAASPQGGRSGHRRADHHRGRRGLPRRGRRRLSARL
jgi:quinoprotein glucose dehydrogenase